MMYPLSLDVFLNLPLLEQGLNIYPRFGRVFEVSGDGDTLFHLLLLLFDLSVGLGYEHRGDGRCSSLGATMQLLLIFLILLVCQLSALVVQLNKSDLEMFRVN